MNKNNKTKNKIFLTSLVLSSLFITNTSQAVSGVSCRPDAQAAIEKKSKQATEASEDRDLPFKDVIEDVTSGALWNDMQQCTSVPRSNRLPGVNINLSDKYRQIKNAVCRKIRTEANEMVFNKIRGIMNTRIPYINQSYGQVGEKLYEHYRGESIQTTLGRAGQNAAGSIGNYAGSSARDLANQLGSMTPFEDAIPSAISNPNGINGPVNGRN